MSVLFTDSNCDLSENELKLIGAECINFPYTLDGKVLEFNSADFNYVKFYSKLRKDLIATTEALDAHNYINAFTPYLEANEDILYITFSSKMSNSFVQLDLAIKELLIKYPNRKIKVIDTLNISSGAGLIVYEAGVMHKRGATDDEIIDFIKKFRYEVSNIFTVDQISYLERNQFIGEVGSAYGSMLAIKPVFGINDQGKITNVAKVQGRKKAINKLFDMIMTFGENVADFPIIIEYTDCVELAEDFRNKLLDTLGKETRIWLNPISPAIGAYLGSNAIGIVFHSKKRII